MPTVEIQSLLRRGFHADNGNIVTPPHFSSSHRRRRVTGHHDGLYILRHQKIECFGDKSKNLFAGLCSVRNMILIRKKDKLFPRQHFHGMVKNRKSANSGIKQCDFQIIQLLKYPLKFFLAIHSYYISRHL